MDYFKKDVQITVSLQTLCILSLVCDSSRDAKKDTG